MKQFRHPKTFGYARVSTTGQNLARQLVALHEAGIPDADIFTDQKSGKDFDRPAWKRLLRKLRPGDLLVVTSLDRFGRNYAEMTAVWSELVRTRNVHIRVLDMPILDTTVGQGLTAAFIGDLVLRVLSYVAETERAHIRQRQKEGIAAATARGVKFGRPAKKLPNNIFVILEQISANRISIRAASRTYDIPKTTLWRLVKEAPQNAVARSSQSIS